MMCGESAPILRDAAAAFAEENAEDLLQKVAATNPQNMASWIQVGIQLS
jgi:hypothetical protein